MGRVPDQLLAGSAHVDGRMIGITESAEGRVINQDRMWRYTEGITNYDRHPGSCPAVVAVAGRHWNPTAGTALPGFDTLGTLEHRGIRARLHLVHPQPAHHRGKFTLQARSRTPT